MDILYFEPTDEVTKAIERLKDSDGQELALVLPRGSLILQSIVNLKLILRTAKSLGKKIVVVTVDKIGRNLAIQVGIDVYGKIENNKLVGKVMQNAPQPVTPQALRDQMRQDTEDLTTVTGIQVHRYDYSSLDNIDEATKPEPNSRAATITHLRDASGREQRGARFKLPKKLTKYLVGLLIIAAIMAAGWLYWFFPKTTISLKLSSEPHQEQADVTAVKENQQAGEIALAVSTINKTGNKNVPATGSKDVGQKATGNITLVNQYSTNSQSVPAGSILTATSGVRFLTTTGVVIPGADISVEGSTTTLNKSGRVEVAIIAENPGSQYNLNGGRLTIEGITDSKDGKVYAETPSTSGGSSETKTVVAQSDIDNAKASLISDLTNQATDEALANLASGDVIDEATSTNVVSFSTDHNTGDEVGAVTVSLSLDVNLLAIDQNELKQVIAKSVNNQLASDKEFAVSDGGLSYTIKSLNVGAGQLVLSVTAKGNIAAKLDKATLQKSLLGKSRGQAQIILEQVPFYQNAEFKFDPSWFIRRVAPASKSLSLNISYSS